MWFLPLQRNGAAPNHPRVMVLLRLLDSGPQCRRRPLDLSDIPDLESDSRETDGNGDYCKTQSRQSAQPSVPVRGHSPAGKYPRTSHCARAAPQRGYPRRGYGGPKGTDLSEYSQRYYLTIVADEINNRPRKSLGFVCTKLRFRAPAEVMVQQIRGLHSGVALQT